MVLNFSLTIQDSKNLPNKVYEPVESLSMGVGDDPLGDFIKNLSDVYRKPVEFLWDVTKFRISNVKALFFLIYYDVTEIISSDKCLNISILQLWMI